MTDEPARDSASEPGFERTLEPASGGGPGSAGDADARSCAWCGAAAHDDAARCEACGAALAQRESIGDLRIPGLTSVDPALEDYDKRPLHLRGPSPTQGMAPAMVFGAMAGGPLGLAAIGGVAAVAAVEYLGAGRGGGAEQSLGAVGKPSEVVLQALEHIDEAEVEAQAQAAAFAATSDHAAAASANRGTGDGRDIWRDLPGEGARPDQEEDADGP